MIISMLDECEGPAPGGFFQQWLKADVLRKAKARRRGLQMCSEYLALYGPALPKPQIIYAEYLLEEFVSVHLCFGDVNF